MMKTSSSSKQRFRMDRNIKEKTQKSILCICEDNICYSPIAEAAFQKLIQERGLTDKWKVDSAALGGQHIGSFPDRRARSIFEKHGIDFKQYGHKARLITRDDFKNFDFIFGMEEDHINKLERLAPRNNKAELLILCTFHPEGNRLPNDPYDDKGYAGFEKLFQHCLLSCAAFLDQHSS